MKEITEIERKEPNKEEIQKILKQNILKLFAQMKKGCKRNICYNTYCANNILCKNSKYIF
jgi:AAA+ superfamily predicted ATPase